MGASLSSESRRKSMHQPKTRQMICKRLPPRSLLALAICREFRRRASEGDEI